MAIWGNHSDTQYPDYKHAWIGTDRAIKLIDDPSWLEETFIPTVAKRGSAVIKARGASSAASAANAAIESMKSACLATPGDEWFSAGVVSDGSYGVPPGLVYSYPLQSDGTDWRVVQGLDLDESAKKRIAVSADELVAERDAVKDLLGPAV